MTLAGLRIGIVGAGIGGLALAALLARQGARVEIIERFDRPHPIGSGLVVQPVGMAVLEEIGIADQARSLGQPIHRMEGRTSRKLVLEADYPDGGTGLGMHRASLHHLLWQAAQTSGAVIRCGQTVTGYAQSASGIRIAGSAAETGEDDREFDLLVDASGASSALSALAARPLEFGAVWGTVPWPEDSPLPPDQLTQHYWRAAKMAGVLPIGRLPGSTTPLAAVFWSLPDQELAQWPQQSAADFAAWHDQLRAFWPAITPFLQTLQRPSDLTPARYSHGALPRPHQGLLVHLGDAAHRASPQLGQGANMALLDALSLVRALCHEQDIAAALRHHQKTRRAHLGLYQGLSAVLTPMYQSHSRVLPLLRDNLLAPATRFPGVRNVIGALVSGTLIPPLRGQDLTLTARKARP